MVAGDDRLDPVAFVGAALLDSFGLARRSRLRQLFGHIVRFRALMSRQKGSIGRLASGRENNVSHPRPMLRGVKKLDFKFIWTMAAYDLIKLPRLIGAAA
jgi:hypothetical protein